MANCFDPEDLGSVYLFDGDKYVGSFHEIIPAQRFGSNKDMQAVGRLKAIDKKVKAHRTAKREQYGNVPMGQYDNEIQEITGDKTEKVTETQKDGYSQ